MSFSLYVDPETVVGTPGSETRQLLTGLGFDDKDQFERALVFVYDECDCASIELSRDELQALIVTLVALLGDMGSDA